MLGKNSKLKSSLYCLCSILLGFECCISPAMALGNVESQKQSKADLQIKRNELDKKLKNTQKDSLKKQETKKLLSEQISVVQEQIRNSNDCIDKLEIEISGKKEDIKNIEKRIEHDVEILKSGLATIYEEGDTTTVDILVGAKDFSDFIDKLDIVRMVGTAMDNIINQLRSDLKELRKTEKELIDKKASKELEQKEQEKNRKDLQELLDQNQQVIDELGQTAQELQDEISKNDAKMKAIDDEIKRYYEEQKRLEQERKERERKAREEAAKSGKPVNKIVSSSEVVPSKEGFIWPVPGYHHITSGFTDKQARSKMHGAIDIGGSGGPDGSIYGANVIASNSGKVTCAKPFFGYGNCVMINHGNGRMTIYGHLSSISVKEGDTVERGQLIGHAGNTGFSTGPHLHFEYRVNGVQVDPKAIVSY